MLANSQYQLQNNGDMILMSSRFKLERGKKVVCRSDDSCQKVGHLEEQ